MISTGMENFTYPPLPVGVDAIRILTVKPGQFSDPVVGTLATVTFSSKPRYIALSYTWKDPYPEDVALPISLDIGNVSSGTLVSSAQRLATALPSNQTRVSLKATITLNGCHFPVRHNLYLALMHLRSPTHGLPLWVDAICINQGDIIERNSQVAMMSFIYTRAMKVAAWLGAKDYQGKINILQYMASDWNAGQVKHMASSLTDSTKLRYSLEPDQVTFARIMASAYWDRLWVVQEVCLPRILVFVHGSRIWSSEDVEQWQLLKAARHKYQLPGRLQGVGSDGFEAMTRLLDARSAKYTDAMRLEKLIETFAGSGCEELRDRVYSLLGMAMDASPFSTGEFNKDSAEEDSISAEPEDVLKSRQLSSAFRVDYHRSFYDIWADLVKFAYFRVKNRTRHRPLKTRFKNWISNAEPNFIPDPESIRTAERRKSIVRAAAIFQEALGQTVEEEVANLKFPKETTIRTMGYVSGEIIQLGPEYASLVGSFRSHQGWLDSWEDYYENLTDLGTLRRINDEYTAKIVDYEAKDLSRICAISSPSTVAWPVFGGKKPEGLGPGFTTELENIQHEVQNDQQDLSNEPRICLGTDFLVAVVPSNGKVGDIIVRFWDCNAAILMRPIGENSAEPSENSSFMLIGRVDVADHISSITSPGGDVDTEKSSSKPTIDQASAIYVDLDLHTFQTITASTTCR